MKPTLLLLALPLLLASCEQENIVDTEEGSLNEGSSLNIEYPGAPIISIKISEVTWHERGVNLLYRFEANEPLPYDIEVNTQGELFYQSAKDGKVVPGPLTLHEHKHKYSLRDANGYVQERWREDAGHVHMIKDRTVLGVELAGKHIIERIIEGNRIVSSSIEFYIKSLTISIVPWEGIGDAPYNVGNSSSITITLPADKK